MIDDKDETFEVVGGGRVNSRGEKVITNKEAQNLIENGKELLKSVPEILDDLNKNRPQKEENNILDIRKRRGNPKLILTKDPNEADWFVEMQGSADSAIACVAMACRADYKFVSLFIPRSLKAKFKDVPGHGRIAIQSFEMGRMLYDMGVLARIVVCLNIFENYPGQKWRADHKNAIYEYDINDLQTYIFLGGKAILGVPGHEDKNIIHWIYVEGKDNIYDPYPIGVDRYRTLNGLMIAEAIIVGGVPDGAK